MKVWPLLSGARDAGRAESRDPGTAGTAADGELEEARRRADAMRWRYHLVQDELDRLRRELRTAEKAREQQDQRRSALVEAIVDSVPSAMLTSRRQGWDEGWEAARNGLPKSANPHTGSPS